MKHPICLECGTGAAVSGILPRVLLLDTLLNEVTIDDPGAYARPFKVTFTALLRPGEELMEYICQENNQDVALIQGPPTAPGDPDRPLGTLRKR